MDATLQNTLAAGAIGLAGWVLKTIDGRIEKWLGQKRWQKSASGVLATMAKEIADMKQTIATLNQSQRDLMREVLKYSKRQAATAAQMAEVVNNFVGSVEVSEPDEEGEED